MGSTNWMGDHLNSGYRTHIAGKEVQLENQVKKSQLPTIIQPSRNSSAGVPAEMLESEETTLAQNSSGSVIAVSLTKFISPSSFYAAPVPKKPKGPLSVRPIHLLTYKVMDWHVIPKSSATIQKLKAQLS